MEFITDLQRDAIERKHRAEFVANIRRLADFIESSDAPVSTYDSCMVYHYGESLDEARSLMSRAPGNWSKDASGNQFSYEKTFGTLDSEVSNYPYPHNVAGYSIQIAKSGTCERVQVDTKHVDAIPAHDEPVYEWKCGPETQLPDIDLTSA